MHPPALNMKPIVAKPTANLALRENFFGEGSVEVAPPPPGAKEGGIRRLAVTADKLLTQPSPDVNVLPDVLEHAAARFPHKNAVGWRDIVRIVEEQKVIKKVVNGEEKEETKIWKYFELSDPKYLTFPEYRSAVREVAKALVSLGVKKDDDVINIYAQTRCDCLFWSDLHSSSLCTKSQLAAHLASMLTHFHAYRNFIRDARRGRPHPLAQRTQLPRRLHQCRPPAYAHQSSPQHSLYRVYLL